MFRYETDQGVVGEALSPADMTTILANSPAGRITLIERMSPEEESLAIAGALHQVPVLDLLCRQLNA